MEVLCNLMNKVGIICRNTGALGEGPVLKVFKTGSTAEFSHIGLFVYLTVEVLQQIRRQCEGNIHYSSQWGRLWTVQGTICCGYWRLTIPPWLVTQHTTTSRNTTQQPTKARRVSYIQKPLKQSFRCHRPPGFVRTNQASTQSFTEKCVIWFWHNTQSFGVMGNTTP